MGEWSKTIGEYGEKTVENFLKLIGWGLAPKGVTVDCLKPKEHITKTDAVRQTHGIDFYFSYLSPLVDMTLMNVHISSKYTSDKYPNSPVRVFKEHVQELVWGIECFKYSLEKKEIIKNLKGYKHVQEVGVLFWLSNDRSSYDDLALKVAPANIVLGGPINVLYLVDNKRISFITQSIDHAKKTHTNQEINFFYPNTGKNVIPLNKKDYGPVLPIEYINASVLPIRLTNGSKTTLCLYSIDEFSKSDFAKLIGLSQDLSKSWAAAVNIVFPDYDELLHSPQVREVKLGFQNAAFTELVDVSAFSNSFKSLND